MRTNDDWKLEVMKLVILSIILSVGFNPMASGLDKKLAEECVYNICGSKEEYEPRTARGVFESIVPEDIKNLIAKEIDPSINEMVEMSVKRMRMHVYLGIKDAHAVNPVQSVHLLIESLNQLVDPVILQLIATKEPHIIELSLVKFKKVFPEIPEENAKKIIAILNAYYRHNAFLYAKSFRDLNIEQIKKAIVKLLGQQNVAEISAQGMDPAIYFINTTNELANYINNQFDGLIYTDKELQFFDKHKKIESNSLFENEILAKLVVRFFLNSAVISDDVTREMSAPLFSIEQMSKWSGWDERQKYYRETLSSPEKLSQYKKKIATECRQKVVKLIAMAPSDLKMKKFAENFSEVKIAAKQVAKRFFKGEALALAEASLDKLKSAKPYGVDQAEARVKTFFKYKKELMRDQLAAEEIAFKDDNKRLSLIVKAMVSNPSAKRSLFNFEGIDNFCYPLDLNSYNDAFNFADHEVITSSQSIQFQEDGVSIMAHEVGHVVSFAVRDLKEGLEAYEKVNECSTERNKSLLKGLNTTAAADQYNEEDWADEFAYEIIDQLKRNKKFFYEKNQMCSYMYIDESELFFERFALVDDTGLGSHSTDLVRLLRSQVRAGGALPVSCKKMLGPELEAAVTKSCVKAN